jgi:UDP-N-acetyl-D-mannosaminuronate dehydrogenase
MLSQLKKVGFVGIGKLGLPCAEVMAQEYDVTGYDIYPKVSDKIRCSGG